MKEKYIKLHSLLELGNKSDMDLQICFDGYMVNNKDIIHTILRERELYAVKGGEYPQSQI